MSEANYTYIKGRGWVPVFSEHIYTCKCGQLVELQYRTPQDGERYFTTTRYATMAFGDSTLNYLKTVPYDKLKIWPYMSDMVFGNGIMVVIPL